MSELHNILAVILGGGRGSRLSPLTQRRSKPDIPIAGKYRLIDIPISNCVNSNIYRIAVLTQYNSVSLHHHISRTYQSTLFQLNGGWVQIWAAEQTMENADWYLGTADAVRKQLLEIQETRAKNVLILAGDELYKMDFSQIAKFHQETRADVTVAVHPVAAKMFPVLASSIPMLTIASTNSLKNQPIRPYWPILSVVKIRYAHFSAQWGFIYSEPKCSLTC